MGRAWEFPEYPENWAEISAEVKRRAKHRCEDCGAKPSYLHAHHIRSLSKGGTNDLSNLKAVCEECHRKYHPHMQQPADRPPSAPRPKKSGGKTGMYCPPAGPPREMTLPDQPRAARGRNPPTAVGGRIGCLVLLGPVCVAGAVFLHTML